MPARVLANGAPGAVPRYAILGTYSDQSGSPPWVAHASLALQDGQCGYGNQYAVAHMCPPLQLGPGTRHHYPHLRLHTTTANVVGYIEGLTDDEKNQIDSWISYLNTQTRNLNEGVRARSQYVMYPAYEDKTITDPVTGVRRSIRFSCVGFVLNCYENGADIRLLDTGSPQFPKTDLATLASVYGGFVTNDPVSIGLAGQGPWAVPLPGHLFFSLRRSARQVRRKPYVPGSANEAYFKAGDEHPPPGCVLGLVQRVIGQSS